MSPTTESNMVLPLALDRNISRKIMIGADPEIFAFGKTTGLPISVHDILPGTKEEPFKVPRGSIQVDGVAAEFNITPANTCEAFIQSIKTVQGIMAATLRSKNESLEFRLRPIAYFPKNYFESLPKHVRALGCQPDWNAYTREPNKKPDPSAAFRTAAGHIHIGWISKPAIDWNPWEDGQFDLCCRIVKELDFALYNSSLNWDSDNKRRELYGKPGAFRPKPYGLEYRVLSNMWLKDVGIQRFVFDTTKAVTIQVLKGLKISEGFSGDIVNHIDFQDFLASRNLPNLFAEKYGPNNG